MNVFKERSWGSFRSFAMTKVFRKVKTEHAVLKVMNKGDLSSFEWVESPLKYTKIKTNSAFCQIYYTSLNFKDALEASGKLALPSVPGDLTADDSSLGIEFSGCMGNGQRVMGLVASRGLATTAIVNPDFLWEVPENWSLEEASTVPSAYSTAYYALIMRGNLRKKERVLIHSGSEAVGQAAIAVSLSLECEVFTSVGSSKEKEFLKMRFSQLQDRNICYFRDSSFQQHVLSETDGEGVDVILNSLPDEKLAVSLRCLSESGRYLEIGEHDLVNDIPSGILIFLKNSSFIGVKLDHLLKSSRDSIDKKELHKLLKDGITNNIVKPLDTILFEHHEAEKAFRLLVGGGLNGKVIIKINDEEFQKGIEPTPVQLEALSCFYCNPERSYVIIGGLGGFGLELCQWLVERGAQHIVLTSRSGIKTGYQKLCLNKWKEWNINVHVSLLNVANMDDTIALLTMAEDFKPVAAIFNIALVLSEATTENQIVEQFKEVCESKVTTTLNLDAGSRKLCPKLEWFVCFSSVAVSLGNAGLSNYAYANSVMERICENRKQEGYPGLAIQWGLIDDVGVIEEKSYVIVSGTVPQNISSCLTVLEKFLLQHHPVVSSFAPYEPSEIITQKEPERKVLASICHMFGVKDISTINLESSLRDIGIDSLLVIEIKQFLEREFALEISNSEVRKLKVKDIMNLQESIYNDNVTGTLASENNSTSVSTYDMDVSHAGLFATLSSNHLYPTETIIAMNSVKTGIPLFLIHAIEGTVEVLNSVAQKLNVPVYGIQFTPDAPTKSMELLAASYWKSIMAMKTEKTIFLAGYSFGAVVAFEMCLQAEQDSHKYAKVLNLIMLEFSPAIGYDNPLLKKSKIEIEAQLLTANVLRYVEVNILEFTKELMKLPTFDARIDKCAEKILATYNNLQSQDLKLALNLYHKRTIMFLKYSPKQKLKKEVTLIKASQSLFLVKNYSENYDLEKVCVGKINVHTAKGNHTTFLLENGAKETAKILNNICSQEF